MGPAKLPRRISELLQVQDSGAALEASSARGSVGSYFDDSGDLVVAVSDEATAPLVRAAGAIPKLVRYTASSCSRCRASSTTSRPAPARARSGPGTSTRSAGRSSSPCPPGAVTRSPSGSCARPRPNGAKVDRSRGLQGRSPSPTSEFGLLGGYQVDKNTGYTCSLGLQRHHRAMAPRIFLTAGHCTAASRRSPATATSSATPAAPASPATTSARSA